MSKPEREEALSMLADRIFSAMLEELVIDVTLQSHHEVARILAVCDICGTRCGLGTPVLDYPLSHHNGNYAVHPAGSSTSLSTTPPSRIPSPSLESVGNGIATGTNTPTGVKDGNTYFECLNCKRQIASNRYAPHLSSCLGIGTGTRRGATRNANAKSKQSSETARSASPYFGSDNGHVPDDDPPSKGKGKSKSRRADDAEFNLKRKRPASPQVSPNKKQKKSKSSGSPISRVKAEADGTKTSKPHLVGSQSKVPSKLRANSTASFIEHSTSPSSRSSSPGTPVASISTPTSTLSARSPSLIGVGRGGGKSKGLPVNALPPKPPSPPRTRPPARLPEPDYMIDVENDGDETGSSTDTDSS